MKKQVFLLVIIFSLFYGNSFGCEICGCSHSNFQIGLLPTFQKGFIGLRYSYSTFYSQMRDDHHEHSSDYYQTMELWGGYNLKRIQVMAFMPYINSRKVTHEGTTISNGAGDLMLLFNYNIFGKTSLTENEKTTFRHELYFGGGIKLPTGVNDVDDKDPEFNIGDFNSQAGTGSVDYLVNVTYNFLWNKSGVVTNLAYRINSANDQDYKFGNRVYLNSSYFYTFTKGEMKFKPNTGLSFQNNTINTFKGTDVEDSDGYNLNATAGINILRKKIGFNATGFIPVSQNNFDGQTELKSRILVGFTYSL